MHCMYVINDEIIQMSVINLAQINTNFTARINFQFQIVAYTNISSIN